MKNKNFALRIASIIFGVIAIIDLARIFLETSVVIAGWPMPIWVNWIVFFAVAFLSGWLWSVSENKRD